MFCGVPVYPELELQWLQLKDMSSAVWKPKNGPDVLQARGEVFWHACFWNEQETEVEQQD